VRILPAVKEDQPTGPRPDDRALPFHRVDVGRGQIMREDEFAAATRRVIGAEEKAGQRV